MISSAGVPSASACVEVVGESLALAVDDPPLQSFADRQREQLGGTLGLGVGGGHTFEELQEALQRVVRRLGVGGRPPPVVDHVERHFPLLVGDPGHRDDLGGVHDGGVQTGVDALVEEHRVEHDAGRRVETEGDIGQARASSGHRGRAA